MRLDEIHLSAEDMEDESMKACDDPSDDATMWSIKAQIIDDKVSGLKLHFRIRPNGTPAINIYGDALEFGNRSIGFDMEGNETDAGTALGSCSQFEDV